MRGSAAIALLGAMIALACVLPTDRSGSLRVEVTALPTLLLKDSLRLEARLVDAGGAEVPRAALAYSSSNPTVFIVGPEGTVRAVGVGQATLTVAAVGFAAATPYTQDVRVRGKLEVDSIRPLGVRFGDSIEIFGVGLDPDSLFSIAIGGVDAEPGTFIPADPDSPEREGILRVWVPPPAPRRAAMTLLGFAGGLVIPDTIDVAQRDLFEPNDTLPRDLGQLPQGFRNPALALEAQQREPGAPGDARQAADWYTFENAAAGDRTVIFFSEGALGQAFGVFLTDSLEWSRTTGDYAVGPQAWAVGIQTYLCGGRGLTRNGEPVAIEEVLFPLSVLALRDLPAGRYHVLVPYIPFGTPTRYELLILNQYASVLSPDAAEENDYCDEATPLTFPASGDLTVDNPHDVDWFRFSVGSTLPVPFDVAVTAQNAEADLDLYLVGDHLPDSLVLVNVASEPGRTELLSDTLSMGDYFLIVVDFPGQPTSYTLSAATGGPLPVAAARRNAVTAEPLDSALARLRAKGAAARQTARTIRRPAVAPFRR